MAQREAREADNTLGSMFASLTWPLLLGLGATAGFFALVFRGPFDHPFVRRYFAGHPINMIETALFFIGLAALLIKLLELLGEFSVLPHVTLGEGPLNQPVAHASHWLETLAQLPRRAQDSYLGRRLSQALEAVLQRGSAESLADELKYLAEVETGRAQDSYALVRIVIWATPMLGFLGTVVAITDALGDLGHGLSNPGAGGGSLNTAMQGLLAGLYVAFDTTAIALCFSIALRFVQFLLDRAQSQLLASVAHCANLELAGRFEMVGLAIDSNLQVMQRMAQGVLNMSEQLVQRQAELWQQSISAAHQQWQQVSRQTTDQMQMALSGALNQSISQLAVHLAKAEQTSSEQLQLRWEQWQTALSQNARLLHAQQQEMVKQGELMTQVIRAAGDVVQLERALNENLAALAGAKNFEDTVMSLAAAIHLLNSRLSHGHDAPQVVLQYAHVKGRAA